ncbi:MAG: hypothetical protein C5B58_06865 [Acidobacteria bacterium]|nr:MAG: hypothetical protein C5B58_06865 [Acidobacteriota bacterium]
MQLQRTRVRRLRRVASANGRLSGVRGCGGVYPSCPRCGSPMQFRRSAYGAFFGCGNFGNIDLQCTATCRRACCQTLIR